MRKVLIGIFILAATVASAQIPTSELKVWLKAGDISVPDNAEVTLWPDASGLGNDFPITTGTGIPIFKAGCPNYLNGQPYVSWNTGKFFTQFIRNDIAGLAYNGPRTIIGVYRLFDTNSRSFVVNVTEGGSFTISHGLDANTWMTVGNRFGFYSMNNSFDTGTPTDQSFHIQYVLSNSMTVGTNVNADTEYWIDNNLQTLTSTSGNGLYLDASTSNRIYLGGYTDVAELIIYNRAITPTERADINTYLKNKYGSFPIAPPPAVPTVTSFTPDNGSAGTTITISGTNFASGAAVTFNGVAASSVTVNSTTSITAVAPAGVTPGPVGVTVGCVTAKSVANFIPPYTPSGNTVTCNGTTDYITIPDNTALRPASITLSTWVKFTSLTSFVPLITKRLGTAINDSYALWYETNLIRGTVEDINGSNTPVQFSWTPNLNQWYHIAFTCDDATKVQSIYVNGAKLASTTNAASPQYDGSPVLIAADVDNGVTSEGPVILDEVRIWNTALTQSQLQSTMYTTLNGNEAGLVGYYKMDEIEQGADLVVKNSATATGPSLNGLTVGTCMTPIFTVVPPPTITGFTPTGENIGATITITGTNFSTIPARNIVKFNGVVATVSESTSTTITTKVPVGATTGVITVGVCSNTAGATPDFIVCVVPAAPSANNQSRCGAGSVVLTASGATNGFYRWYTTASGGSPITDEENSTYKTPSISATTIYYVSIANGGCESGRVPVTAEVKSCDPVIQDVAEKTGVGGKASINVVPLITTVVGSLDINSITIVSQPTSGAKATVSNGVVTIDYTGIPFVGEDHFTIRACDDVGDCSEKELKIDVSGELVVYNALSLTRDGKNDVFYIESIDIIPDAKQNKVTIFNRWGDNVFEVENYDNQTHVFTGMNKHGNQLPAGTYYYKITFVSNRKTMTGYLLIR